MTPSTRRRSPYEFAILGLFAVALAYVILAAILVTLASPACGCAATPIPT